MLITPIMARPHKQRFIEPQSGITAFKPRGIPMAQLEEIHLSLDELESIRLADLGGDLQEEAAAKMNISRATFGRILARAHAKVAEALIEAKALRISGGTVQEARRRRIRCRRCSRSWEVPTPVARGFHCPHCNGDA